MTSKSKLSYWEYAVAAAVIIFLIGLALKSSYPLQATLAMRGGMAIGGLGGLMLSLLFFADAKRLWSERQQASGNKIISLILVPVLAILISAAGCGVILFALRGLM